MLMEIEPVLRRPRWQHIEKAFSPRRVRDFADNRSQLPIGFMAIEETHRVERQAPTAGLCQQADRPLRRVAYGFADLQANRINQAHALAGKGFQVIRFAKREGRKTAGAAQGRQAEYGVLLIEVQVQQTDPIAEFVVPWGKPPVGDPATVEGAVLSTSPKERATRKALTTPSSWKPLAQ